MIFCGGGCDVVGTCGVSVFGNELINSLKAFVFGVWFVLVNSFNGAHSMRYYDIHNKRNDFNFFFFQFFSLPLMNLMISMKKKKMNFSLSSPFFNLLAYYLYRSCWNSFFSIFPSNFKWGKKMNFSNKFFFDYSLVNSNTITRCAHE